MAHQRPESESPRYSTRLHIRAFDPRLALVVHALKCGIPANFAGVGVVILNGPEGVWAGP